MCPKKVMVWSIYGCFPPCKYNCYMGQLQLCYLTNTIAMCLVMVWNIYACFLLANTIVTWDKYNCSICHIPLQCDLSWLTGLKHLCVFPSLLEFQPPPIFLPIELSYCIIAMHWNGSFPRIVFLSHSFPPLITIQQAQHTHRSNLFWPRTFDIVWIPLFICSETYWKYTLWAPRMLWTTLFSLSLSSSYFCFALHCTDFAPQRVRGICKRISSDAVQMDLSPNKSQVCLFRSDITKSS